MAGSIISCLLKESSLTRSQDLNSAQAASDLKLPCLPIQERDAMSAKEYSLKRMPMRWPPYAIVLRNLRRHLAMQIV
jgi:hypothetical protein